MKVYAAALEGRFEIPIHPAEVHWTKVQEVIVVRIQTMKEESGRFYGIISFTSQRQIPQTEVSKSLGLINTNLTVTETETEVSPWG